MTKRFPVHDQLVPSRCGLIVSPFVHFLRPREPRLCSQLLQEYFNVNAFVPNPKGTFGDTGRSQT